MRRVKRTEISRWLSKNGYESIEPFEFYRSIFPAGELAEHSDKPRSEEANSEWKYNAILLENTHRSKSVKRKNPRTGKEELSVKEIWRNYIVLDDLKRIEVAVRQYGSTESEFFISPMSYLGRRRDKYHERWIYACIVEVDHPRTDIIDGHRVQRGLIQLIYDWTDSPYSYLMPTACVSSGSGLHLVYLLDRPYQIIDEYQKQQWDNFRKAFTKRIWNQYVTKTPIQFENHCQSFRVVGTRTKNGQRVEAFWLSKKRYSIDELFGQVEYDEYPKWNTFEEYVSIADTVDKGLYEPDDLMKITKEYMPKLSKDDTISPGIQLAREKYGEDWYQRRIIEKQPPKAPGQWTANRGLYEWFLREAKKSAYVGSRYHRVHALAEYAVKCGVSYDDLKSDAFDLYMIFKDIDASEPFRYLEFVKARDEYFNALAHKSTRKWIEENTGVSMKPPAKRNGRKRDDHIKRLNKLRKFKRDDLQEDEYKNNGRPDKQSIVEQWQTDHPDGRKADCIRDTGISKPTVYKWWKG